MTNRKWILSTIAAVAVVVMAAVTSMMATDDYGLFRNPAGRSLPIFYADRMGKVLLNLRYVPSDFDALLVGPSSSVNWEPKVITEGTGLTMYNESIEGGNASEERLLVDEALRKGHFKVALVLLYPTMISSHEYHDGIDKVRWTEALGSLDAYVQTTLSELSLHHHMVTSKQHASGDGSHEMRNPRGKILAGPIDFREDSVGMRDLASLTESLEQHHVRVVYVVPTVYESMLEANRVQFSHFVESVLSRLPQGPVIDLNTPEYTSIRSNPDNYIDAFHVTPNGARQLSEILNGKLRGILSGSQGR